MSLLTFLSMVLLVRPGAAQCPMQWQPGFHVPGLSDGNVKALTVFDDGSGLALFVGGYFTGAGDQEAFRLAKWDGTSWTSVEYFGGSVSALVVHDDGTGAALYAGDSLGVSRWDGVSWSAVGTNGPVGTVLAFAVFDDGAGPALYAGGSFGALYGSWEDARCIAKWDGQTWSEVGGGVSYFSFIPEVRALAVYDAGTGPALYVGGNFDEAGELDVFDLVRWDGQSWSQVGSGVICPAFGSGIDALTVYDPPGPEGPGLYAAGAIGYAGGQPAHLIARWDGTAWSPLGEGLEDGAGRCSTLAAYDDGSGAALYAGGDFLEAGGQPAQMLAKWDGADWTPFDVQYDVRALAVFDPPGDEQGPGLYLGGYFMIANDTALPKIGRLDAAGFSRLGNGNGPSSTYTTSAVYDLCPYDDGTGLALYVGGTFRTAGDVVARGLARWDGAAWSALPDLWNSYVHALVEFDPPGADEGPALYAAGYVQAPAGHMRRVQRWDGASWSDLGEDVALEPLTMTVHDDGTGPALYVAGHTELSYEWGFPANRIARWNGTSWSDVGGGIGQYWDSSSVYALCEYDDGAGPALYAGGDFVWVGDDWVPGIAKWDGEEWSDVDGGVDGVVLSLVVFDPSGTGASAELYVAGGFDYAGELEADGFASWNGTGWTPLELPLEGANVRGMDVLDLGDGLALYVGALYYDAEDAERSAVLKWDGTNWSTLAECSGYIHSFAELPEPDGVALYAAGILSDAGCSAPVSLAKLVCPSDFQTADLNCDGVIDQFDIDPFVAALVDPEAYAAEFPDCYLEAADCNGDSAVNAFDIDPFIDALLERGFEASYGSGTEHF